MLKFDIDNYSALIIVGDDACIHQAINGLLSRKDGKKIPIGLIPNGSENDICASVDIQKGNFEKAL